MPLGISCFDKIITAGVQIGRIGWSFIALRNHFLFSQNFRLKELKYTRNSRINWKFFGLSGLPSVVLHFSRSSQLERLKITVLFTQIKISISAASSRCNLLLVITTHCILQMCTCPKEMAVQHHFVGFVQVWN